MSIEALRAKLAAAQERQRSRPVIEDDEPDCYPYMDFYRAEWIEEVEELPIVLDYSQHKDVMERLSRDVFMPGAEHNPYRLAPAENPALMAIRDWLLTNARILPELWFACQSDTPRHTVYRFANEDDAMLFRMRWQGAGA